MSAAHCHAGGATRRADGVAVRCAEALDGASRPLAEGFGSRGELATSWRSGHPEVPRHLYGDGVGGWLQTSRGHVLVAACGADQRAHEYRMPGGGRGGALTHFLLAALDRPAWEETSWSRLHGHVLAGVHGVFEDQTPMLEGAAERRPFGGAVRPLPPAIPVVRSEPDGRVLLAAGLVQGVGEGSRLAVYPPDATDLDDPASRLAVVEVVNAGPARAWAQVRGEEPPGAAPVAIPDAARAVVVDPGQRRLATGVSVRSAEADPAGRAPLAAVERALGATVDSFLRRDGEVDLQVAIDDGSFVVLDRGGAEISLCPPLPAWSACVDRLVRRLSHLARYRAVERLANPDPYGALAGRVTLEVLRRGDDGEEGEPLRPGADGRLWVTDGWKVEVVVRNDSRLPVHAALLTLQADRGVVQVWPSSGLAGSELLDPGTTHTVALEARLPPGLRRGRDVLKVLAATAATDFRWLQLPPLDRPLPGTDRGFRAVSALERLLAALTSERGHAADLAAGAAHGWTTAQVETYMRSG